MDKGAASDVRNTEGGCYSRCPGTAQKIIVSATTIAVTSTETQIARPSSSFFT